MNSYFQQYKPFLLFLSKFFLSYLLLTVGYQIYLSTYAVGLVDGITTNVAQLTSLIAKGFGISIQTKLDGPQYRILYNGDYVSRIIEGCNAISVVILFIAFVIAFSARLKPTFFYVLGGSLFIYFINVLRIIVLTILLANYPNQEHFLHGVLFPLIIYGFVFLLWYIWINKYSNYASK